MSQPNYIFDSLSNIISNPYFLMRKLGISNVQCKVTILKTWSLHSCFIYLSEEVMITEAGLFIIFVPGSLDLKKGATPSALRTMPASSDTNAWWRSGHFWMISSEANNKITDSPITRSLKNHIASHQCFVLVKVMKRKNLIPGSEWKTSPCSYHRSSQSS